MSVLSVLAALAAGYFLGGLPTAMLVARLRGRDIFEVGSGNMGAMNTARHLGPLLGVAVFAIDVGKGAAAVALGAWMAEAAGLGEALPAALAAGVGAVGGHAWSPYVRFRGGKALATIFGATLALAPSAALYAALLLIAMMLLLRRADPASIVALALYPLVTAAALARAGWRTEDVFATATAAALAAAIGIAKHLAARRAAPVARDR